MSSHPRTIWIGTDASNVKMTWKRHLLTRPSQSKRTDVRSSYSSLAENLIRLIELKLILQSEKTVTSCIVSYAPQQLSKFLNYVITLCYSIEVGRFLSFPKYGNPLTKYLELQSITSQILFRICRALQHTGKLNEPMSCAIFFFLSFCHQIARAKNGHVA